jgi:hypothetical protein
MTEILRQFHRKNNRAEFDCDPDWSTPFIRSCIVGFMLPTQAVRIERRELTPLRTLELIGMQLIPKPRVQFLRNKGAQIGKRVGQISLPLPHQHLCWIVI